MLHTPENTQKTDPLYVAGIGSSAGGLEALRAMLLNGGSVDNIAFIVVQHMSPSSRSLLGELLARDTDMPVIQATDKAELRPGHVYVTPPNADIAVEKGVIRLTDIGDRLGPKPSIDRFFLSLAEAYRDNAIACILSGTGTDGAQGVRAIHEHGGTVIAQDPETAKYDGMPRAAIDSGAVDFTTKPEELIPRLIRLSGQMASQTDLVVQDENLQPYEEILRRVHGATGVDFRMYKPKTINRRLQRRLHAVGAKSLEEYQEYLLEHPDEVSKLFEDVLISVTSFYRDAEEFDSIRKNFIKYLENIEPPDSLRIWSAGCATGEEPYSLAIMAKEALNSLGPRYQDTAVQVFATDVSDEAMAAARKGFFPAASLDNIDRDLRDKYFSKKDGGYQITKSVRESVLFAKHNLTNDPPFLKMDLISCRNVFIYFEQGIQEKILKIFHYALRPNGLLFLGKSESLGSQKSYFLTLDSHGKVFQRSTRASDPTISFSKLKPRVDQIHPPADHSRRKDRLRMERDLIRDFCPDSIVLDNDLRVISVYGSAGRYLQFPDGPMEDKLETLIQPALKNSVMTILHRCARSKTITRTNSIIDADDEKRAALEMHAYPLTAFEGARIVLGLRTIPLGDETSNLSVEASTGKEVAELETELNATREHLQTVIEEQETSNEELQALNEELQSANEELQSTNEELETSNEELQSTNEELTTLNEELNVKSTELYELSHHLQTVQNAVLNPIIVVDGNFCLQRCNNQARDKLGLRSEQDGQNLRLAQSKLNLDPIYDLMETCLKSGQFQQKHFKIDNLELEALCQPISEDKKSGVVATIIDNTEFVRAQRKAEIAEGRLFQILQHIPAKVAVRDASGHYSFVNPTFCNLVGKSAEEIIGKTDEELFGEEVGRARRQRDLATINGTCIQFSEENHPGLRSGTAVVYHTARVPLTDENGNVVSVCSVGIDISERVRQESQLKDFQDVIATAEQDAFAMLHQEDDDDDFRVSFASDAFKSLGQRVSTNVVHQRLTDIFPIIAPNLPDTTIREFSRQIIESPKANLEFVAELAGTKVYYKLRSYRMVGESTPKIFMILFDETDERNRESLTRSQEEEVNRASRLASLGEMAGGIAHELKTPLNTIQAYVDLINSTITKTPDSPQIRDALVSIESTVFNISEIINGLKSMVRNAPDEDFSMTSIAKILENIDRLSQFHLKNKSIRFTVNAPDSDVSFEAKPTQISQVLINLINNAADAVRDTRNAWIRLEARETGDDIEFRVIDSGPGVPSGLVEKLMIPFFTTKKTGTGIGLSLSRNIALHHNGQLHLDTQAKQTTFVLRIPKKQG